MSNNSVTRLSEFLRIIRLSRGKKQQDMANLLSVSRQTYSHYETGRLVPSVSSLKKIAEFYSMPVLPFVVMAVDAQENRVQNNFKQYNSEEEQLIAYGFDNANVKENGSSTEQGDSEGYAEYEDTAYKDFIDYFAAGKKINDDLDASEILFYYQNMSEKEKKAVKTILRNLYKGQKKKTTENKF